MTTDTKIYCCENAQKEDAVGEELRVIRFENITIHVCTDCYLDLQDEMVKDDLSIRLYGVHETKNMLAGFEIIRWTMENIQDILEKREDSQND